MKNPELIFCNPDLGEKYGYKKDEAVIFNCTLIEENGVLILIWDKNKSQWKWAKIEHFKPKKEEK